MLSLRSGCQSLRHREQPWWSTGKAFRTQFRVQSVVKVSQCTLQSLSDFFAGQRRQRVPITKERCVCLRCYRRSGGRWSWTAWSSLGEGSASFNVVTALALGNTYTRPRACGEGGCCRQL